MIPFLMGGVTLPAIVLYLKRVASFGVWKVQSYSRRYDPIYEYYQKHYAEQDDHIFWLQNISNSSWVFEKTSWADGKLNPYLFISKLSSNIKNTDELIHIENEDSYSRAFPGPYSLDGSDFPAGNTIISPNDVIKITFQNVDNMGKNPLNLHFDLYINDDSLIAKIQSKVNWTSKRKVTLQIP